MENNTQDTMESVVYVRKSIKNYYIDFPGEIDADYWAGKIGETYEDFLDNKWVKLSDEQVAFHKQYPYLGVREVLEMRLPEVPEAPVEPEKTAEWVRTHKLADLDLYDNSIAVNRFFVNDEGAWFTPSERTSYASSVAAAKVLGVENLSFYIGENVVTVPTAMAEQMLAAVQLYADAAFMVTRAHQAAIEKLETVEELEAYDFTAGYPEKLRFNV